MSSEPRVSVVLAAHQAGALAEAAIGRMFALRGDGLEFVLVDDGSTDGTADVFQAAATADPRVRMLSHDANLGLGAARRTGFRAARGEFIWNVDVDDEWPPDAVLSLLSAADGADLVLAAAIRRSDSGHETVVHAPRLITGDSALDALLRGSLTGHLWNKLLRREAIPDTAYGGSPIHSDLVIVLGVLERSAVVTTVDEVVYTYIEHAGSNIRSRRPRGESIVAIDEALTRASTNAASADLVRRFRARAVLVSSLRDAVRADYPADESARRYAAARSRIRFADVVVLATGGDLKNTALLILARVVPGLFRRLLGRRGTAPAPTQPPAAG